MADNTTLNAGAGGDVISTDDIAGVKVQRVKVQHGADGSATDVSAASPMPVDGSGVTQPVSGTVTANLGATDNAVLDNIVTNTADNATQTTLAALNVKFTTGTVIGDVNLGASDAANLNNVDTATTAMNAKLVSGTVIGEVEVGAASTAAGDLAKAEDAVHGSGDVGVMALAVRNDTLAALGSTDGDYAPLQVDANGALFVSATAGSAEKVDDAAFTLATDSVVMIGAIRDDTLSTLTAVEGDAVPFRVNSTGALHVTGAGGGTQYTVDDAGPTTVTMAGVVRDDSLTTLTEADGDASVLRVNSTGALHVTGGGGGTEYTEDVATANPIVGTATLMERDDALSTVTPVEGDWIGLRGSAEGALWVQDFNSDAIAASLAGTLTVDGSGVTQPVSGTVTANLSATDNAVLDTIDAVLDTINAKLVTGTVIGDVNLGATDNAVLDSIVTNTTGLAGTVSGSELQVDVVAALPAGTNAIGKLAANSGVDIGDVDVTSIASGANLIGDVGIGVRTTGGASFYLNQDTSAVSSVKASAGTLYSISCFNTHTAAVYLNLYNVASGSVTLGTTTPSMQFIVPTQAATANGAGFVINFTPGIAFGTAITVACATTFNGLTDPGTNLVLTNITYA